MTGGSGPESTCLVELVAEGMFRLESHEPLLLDDDSLFQRAGRTPKSDPEYDHWQALAQTQRSYRKGDEAARSRLGPVFAWQARRQR